VKTLLYHDSRNTAYRFPFGAVPAGTAVTLRLDVQGDGTEAVFLRLWIDDKEVRYPMTCPDEPPVDPARPLDEQKTECRDSDTEEKETDSVRNRRYEVTFRVPDKGCLVWYYFVVQTDNTVTYYGNNKAQLGGVGDLSREAPPSFQITVYDADAVTPDWLKHAIIYQIFPDRFNRGDVPAERFLGKSGAVVHSAWDGEPAYGRDSRGNVLYYDFYGGTLEGIIEKLDYIADLGVTCLYLNPIFKARSNHRYDTGDYKVIDPFLGDEATFKKLCAEARKRGIRIILDGVFSHTGADSRYFNRYGNYHSVGAAQSEKSPYYKWYQFRTYPNDYQCWWGDKTLPEVKEIEPSYLDFIVRDEDSVMKHWMKAGISGWRLDVADELPDGFLEPFYQELKKTDPDAALIGEVWEDASRKVSYGVQRQYLSGGKLDSVMNYVLRALMVDFALGNDSAEDTDKRYWQQMENYPREHMYAMMNLLGSHDVERILTVLAGKYPEEVAERMDGLLRAWQLSLPGAPTLYYGDEAGLTGGKDPQNRKPFPWGHENKRLTTCCRTLNQLRNTYPALQTGRFSTVYAHGDVYVFARFIEGCRDVFGDTAEDGVFFTALNRSAKSQTVTIDTQGLAYGELETLWSVDRIFGPYDETEGTETQTDEMVPVLNGRFTLTLPPYGAIIYHCVERNNRLPEPGTPFETGVLLHPTSLPGSKNKEAAARAFLDFLEAAGQNVWQILPLNPPGLGDSPYLSLSAFAGNEELFAEEGELAEEETRDFETFCSTHSYWLDDYALFRALRDYFYGRPWQEWPAPIRNRQKLAMEQYSRLLEKEIRKYKIGQYRFYKAWQGIKEYAHQKGIKLFGDMPIFVAPDSADTWAHREFFELDKAGYPTAVAGVPPDYFSADGQVWGNPLYKWDALQEDDWRWWRERFRTLAEQADIVRIDHFRGFAAVWTVDAKTRDARKGHWTPGPGAALFKAIRETVPELRLVAEDLGIITDDVYQLKDAFGFPGMRILEFHCRTRSDGETSFDTEPNCIAYTGTHDNNTLKGWFEEELDDAGRERMKRMVSSIREFGSDEEDTLRRRFLGYLYSRRARTVIVPMQDILGLPSSCRMNLPGTASGNWHWQMKEGVLTPQLAAVLKELVETYRNCA
jgi:4-alpha-glucanotransferase